MSLNQAEINSKLKEYYPRVKQEVSRKLGNNVKFLYDKDDVTQEAIILLYNLIKNNYDPNISSIDTYIGTHISYCIYQAITSYQRSLFFTGKHLYNEDKDPRAQRRPGSKKVDDATIRTDVDFISPRNNRTRKLDFIFRYFSNLENEDIGIFENQILHQEDGYNCYSYDPIFDTIEDAENAVIDKIYYEDILSKVRARLSSFEKDVFNLIIKDNENPKFSTGYASNYKHLAVDEISKELNKDREVIWESIKHIREVVLEILSELESEDNL